MRTLFIVALICGLVLLSGCTQQAPADNANATTTVINATCPDGTLEKACSANKPFYCAGGELIKSIEKCGCPSGQTVSNGECVKQCPDGTLDGQCTADRTRYCSDGVLVIDNSKCGCNGSAYDLIDGECVLARCGDNTTIGSCSVSSASMRCNSGGILEPDPEACGCPEGQTLVDDECQDDCSDGTLAGQCNSASKYCDDGSLVFDATKCSCPSGKIACGSACVVPNCTADINCSDGNADTIDKCLNPGMCNATCSNDYKLSRIYDSDDNPEMHDLEFAVTGFDDIGRELSYSFENGTDMLYTSSSSKVIIEVFVEITAKEDYEFEVGPSSFYLIDDENISYDALCFSKSNKTTTSPSSCYNEGAFEEYDELEEDDVVDGYLYFEISKSNDPEYLAFKFDDSLKPGEIWFRYD